LAVAAEPEMSYFTTHLDHSAPGASFDLRYLVEDKYLTPAHPSRSNVSTPILFYMGGDEDVYTAYNKTGFL
jgi:hypothetical protein